MKPRKVDDRGEEGGAAIEMLLLLPFIILINCFIIQLSHLFIAYQVVQFGAFAAARAAMVADVNPADAPAGTNWKTKAAAGNEYDRPVRAAAQMCSILELMAPADKIRWHKNPIQFNVEGYSSLPFGGDRHPARALLRRVAAIAANCVASRLAPGSGQTPFDLQAASRARRFAKGGGGGGGGGGGDGGGAEGAKYRYFSDDRAANHLTEVKVVLPANANEDEVRVVIVYDTFLPVPFANRIFYQAFSETGRAGTTGDLRVKVIQSCTVVKPWM